jgi:hypothetical protein
MAGKKSQINKGKDEESSIKQFFVEECLKYKLNPLKVASGVWYLGFNSLDILIGVMGTTRI